MPVIFRSPRPKRVLRGVKARRRTELGLLVAAAVIIVTAYTLMILGNTAKVPADVVPLLIFMLVLGGVAHIANRIFVPDAVPVVLPIAFLLNGIGYVFILRIDLGTDHNYAPLQAAWTAGGVAAYVLTLIFIRRSRDLDRYRYLFLGAGVVLLLLPLAPHPVGSTINGARLWVRFGNFQFQPVEVAKILLCIFFASYFAEKRELLTIPTARLGNRLVLDPRPLVPIVLAWAFAIGVMSLEDDIGFSALLFTLFIGLLWVTTGRTGYLLFGVVLFAAGAYVAGRYFSQTHIRVETWLDPWRIIPPNDPGLQLRRAWYALGSGGIGGQGLGLGFGCLRDTEFEHRLHLRRHRQRDGAARVVHGGRCLPAARRDRVPHRPGRSFRVRQAHRHRAHHHHRLPGLLHHRRRRAAAPPDRHHPALRLLRRLRSHRQLRPHRPAHAHLG